MPFVNTTRSERAGKLLHRDQHSGGERSLTASANHCVTRFFLGVMLQETGAYREAMQAFQNSVKLNPKREAAWLNIGHTHPIILCDF